MFCNIEARFRILPLSESPGTFPAYRSWHKCKSGVVDVKDAIFSPVSLVIVELWPLDVMSQKWPNNPVHCTSSLSTWFTWYSPQMLTRCNRCTWLNFCPITIWSFAELSPFSPHPLWALWSCVPWNLQNWPKMFIWWSCFFFCVHTGLGGIFVTFSASCRFYKSVLEHRILILLDM